MNSKMINRLQPFMRDSKIYKEIFNSEEIELSNKALSINDLEKQLTISTATWALCIYEEAVGLAVDNTKPISERRSRIKAKLRGVGKVDAELIKNVISSWTGGTTDVVLGDGIITIKFIDKIGIPENMSDVLIAVDEIKPAHLDVLFILLYNAWSKVAFKRWGDLEAFTWEEVLSSDIS